MGPTRLAPGVARGGSAEPRAGASAAAASGALRRCPAGEAQAVLQTPMCVARLRLEALRRRGSAGGLRGFSLVGRDQLAGGVGWQQGARQHGIGESVELAQYILPDALGDEVGSGASDQI